MYKQSIIFFGLIVPLLAIAGAIGGCYLLKEKMTESFDVKVAQYRVYTQSRNAAMEVENKVVRQRTHIARWRTELSAETTSTARNNLKAISEKLPSKEFQETAFEPLGSEAGFGAASAQKSSQLKLGFRGTFRTVQRALVELETRMPQLVLQEMRIDPSNQQSSLLNFQVNYLVWEN